MTAAANTMSHQSRTALVLGMGLTGYSIVRFLRSRGVEVSACDSRDFPPYLKQIGDEFPDIELTTGRIPYEQFDAFDQVIVSPGISLEPIHGIQADRLVGDIELFAREAGAPVIGITGSNGKSTVTMMVSVMLDASGSRVETGGNIGTPALDLLDRSAPDFYVLELSSFQLEITHTLRLVGATVLNISEDHMDRYGGLSEYVSAKARIYHHAECAVVNREDALSPTVKDGVRTLTFGLDEPRSDSDFGLVNKNGDLLMVRGNRELARVDGMTLQGKQNVANLLAALALVEAAGVELTDDVIKAGMNYAGLPHRCEVVTEVSGVRWINDSKGTNVGATVAAISGIDAPIILIAGGRGKGANFQPLAQAVHRSVTRTILFGEDAQKIAAALGSDNSFTIVASLDLAITEASACSQAGDVVLFSPACSSFDMFDSYEHRGNVFKQLVLERVH